MQVWNGGSTLPRTQNWRRANEARGFKDYGSAKYPKPRTKTVVRSLLGLVGYYRKFIPYFATVAAPLSDLTKKNVKAFEWSEVCEDAFLCLKELMCTAPVLKTPDLKTR